jgi:thiol-disulfide isomerase/thioredoxin
MSSRRTSIPALTAFQSGFPLAPTSRAATALVSRRPLRQYAPARRPRTALCAVSYAPHQQALPHDRNPDTLLNQNFSPNTEPNVVELSSTGDFLGLMARSADAGVPTFVLFHASYCRSCMFVRPKFCALANGRQAVFATVCVEDAPDLAARLGVNQIPLVQVYDGEKGKVEEFKCGPKSLPLLRSVVERFTSAREVAI